MIVIRMQSTVSKAQVDQIAKRLINEGHSLETVQANGSALIIVQGAEPTLTARLTTVEGVDDATRVESPYPLVSRKWQPDATEIDVGGVIIGGNREPAIIAGPCSVESEIQMHTAAEAAKRASAHILRGGAYKPRTNPYSFQGLGVPGLKLLRKAGDSVGLPVVTEVMTPSTVQTVSEYVDLLQIGTRNMANFDLLRAVGESSRPVLLKRGMAATVDEWLQAAEYIVSAGNSQVILCERGIRSFDTSTRNILDIAAAVLAKQLSHLPVMVDPSHGTGVVSLIGPMSLASVAAGVDGVCLEMHPNPAEAFSDGDQALTPAQLSHIVEEIKALSSYVHSVESGQNHRVSATSNQV